MCSRGSIKGRAKVTRINVPLALRVVVVEPACRSDDTAHLSVGENRPRGILPCPTQVGALASSRDGAVDEGVASVLSVALPCLSSDNSKAAVTKHMKLIVKVERCPRAKDVVHCALNIAILEEVEATIVTEGVLESQESAIVEGGFVSRDP